MKLRKVDLLAVNVRAGVLPSYSSDAAFESALGMTPTDSLRYWNSSTRIVREYANGAWRDSTGSGGTVVNNSINAVTTDTFGFWKRASGTPAILSIPPTNIVRVNKSGIEGIAIPGTPIRFTADEIWWYYAQIISVVVNPTTLDLTIEGAGASAVNSTYLEVGSPSQLIEKWVKIPGNLAIGDDQLDSVENIEYIWEYPDSYIIRFSAKVKIAASGTDLIVALSTGLVTNEIAQLNLGQVTTRKYSGSGVHAGYYKVFFGNKLFFKVLQIGSVVPGANLLFRFIAVQTPFTYQAFVPQIPSTPYGFVIGGGTGAGTTITTTGNVISYISLTTNTGSAADVGDDIISRAGASSMFNNDNTFNSGGSTTPFTVHTAVISYIATQSVAGNALNRGNKVVANTYLVGISGQFTGYSCGGWVTGSSASSVIETFDLSVTTGNASATGSLAAGLFGGSGGYKSDLGCYVGGKVATVFSYYQVFSTTTTSTSAETRANNPRVISIASCVSDITNNRLYVTGGEITISGAAQTFISSYDFDVASGIDRGNMTIARKAHIGLSGGGYGNLSSGATGTGAGTDLSSIDVFQFTTGSVTASNRGNDIAARKYVSGSK